MKQLNFNTEKGHLSEMDIQEILTIVAYRCRIKTHKRLESILKYSSSTLPGYGIFGRLIKENGKWIYIAGQSYTDEIRAVRELMLGKRY